MLFVAASLEEPCQDISIAGNKKGLKNEDGKTTRSGLWYEYKRLIEEIKPRFVIIENVRNLLNIGFAEVVKDLCDLGYDAEWEVISARSVGAKHLRERIWIVAYPNSESIREQQELIERIKNSTELRDACKESGIRAMANSNLPRLWPTFATEEEARRWWAEATACISAKWETKPKFCGVSYGLSNWLDFIGVEEFYEKKIYGTDKILRILQKSFDKEKIWESIRGLDEIQASQILWSSVFGIKAKCDHEWPLLESEEAKEKIVRELWKFQKFTLAPQRPECCEQHRVEHDDFMRFMPHKTTLEIKKRGQGTWNEVLQPERHRRERVKSLGNSIVPQIAYLIGKRIMEVEKDFN